jgi:hypothetical protein
MKFVSVTLAVLAFALPAFAQSYDYDYGIGSNSRSNHVDGYLRRDGSYVDSYYRTNPDHIRENNYGARGNFNPYSGHTGRGY